MTITIICETTDKGPHSALAELVRAAHDIGAPATVLLLATEATHADAARSIDGVDQVIALTSPAFSTYDASSWAAAIHATAPEGTIISLANARMKDLLARVAARRDLPVVQDVIAVEGTTFTQPLMSGKAMQTVEVEGSVCLSIRSNSLEPMKNGGDAPLSVVAHDLHPVTTVQDLLARASERLDVSEADIIISGGRGMGDPANFSHLEAVADVLGAAVGASRAAVDTWEAIPHSMQVGQTGKTVTPNLYIAVGISGAIQHLAGMRSSKYIVAINKDPEAPIFKHADYGIVAAWEDALPVLTASLATLRS